ncbi:hypothetical protein [Isoptericola variabilis]|uniref:Uncharacterized protein n=1 Tax=Isoptericola variabilis (strain 225) TaxID=743718 RepID=F6FRP0_ISOV2|nr:hypothetical protein [Isoptericola variabilis]AEG42981.1 hypothetical protein Isova_0171 [Isoptericola variabilis 225]TWH30048.1 hypothetical protein L600_003300000140 [Isoptericola variabilis J7]
MIFLAAPEHPSFYDDVVTTAAHEMLHAAWEQLDVRERAELRDLLEAEVADLGADDPIHEQIEWSTDGSKMARPSELFAYVGTQIGREGGLEPQLEEVYARFISDRSALVAVHTDNPFG